MAKIKNKTYRSKDREHLQWLADELAFIGREFHLDLAAGTLTQFALPRQHKKSKKSKKEKAKAERNKRAESAARRT